jgi:hypothetical protein
MYCIRDGKGSPLVLESLHGTSLVIVSSWLHLGWALPPTPLCCLVCKAFGEISYIYLEGTLKPWISVPKKRRVLTNVGWLLLFHKKLGIFKDFYFCTTQSINIIKKRKNRNVNPYYQFIWLLVLVMTICYAQVSILKYLSWELDVVLAK